MPLYHMKTKEWCHWRERNDVREAIETKEIL